MPAAKPVVLPHPLDFDEAMRRVMKVPKPETVKKRAAVPKKKRNLKSN